MEMNVRIFQDKMRDASGVRSQIEEEVRACLLLCHGVKKNDVNCLTVLKLRVPKRILQYKFRYFVCV